MIKAGNGVLQADVQPGDVKFVDINHDGRVNELDKTDLGNGIPDFTMGFNLGFNWKGLDFSVVANGAFGQQIVQSYRNHTSKQANYTTAILGRWTGEEPAIAYLVSQTRISTGSSQTSMCRMVITCESVTLLWATTLPSY